MLFVPQYVIDYKIPPDYYSLYFAMVSVGSAISNILAIDLRRMKLKALFFGIGIVLLNTKNYPEPVSTLESWLMAAAHWPCRGDILEPTFRDPRDHRKMRRGSARPMDPPATTSSLMSWGHR